MNALIDGFKKLWEKPDVETEPYTDAEGVYHYGNSDIDPLLSCPHMSFEGYLQYTSTCKSLNENRFGNLYRRVDFLKRLFARVLVQDGPTVVEVLLNENSEKEKHERVVSILSQFSRVSYSHELRFSFSDNERLNQSAFGIIAKKFLNIKELKFASDHIISSKAFFDAVKWCQTLTCLEMPDQLVNYSSKGHGKSVPQSLKKLKVSWNIVKQDLHSIIGCSGSLEELNLSGSLAKKGFFRNVIFPASLCSLNLDRTAIENESLPRIAQQCSKLSWLSLDKPDRVTAPGIRAAKFPTQVDILFVPSYF